VFEEGEGYGRMRSRSWRMDVSISDQDLRGVKLRLVVPQFLQHMVVVI